MNEHRNSSKKLFALFLPIFLQTLLMMLSGMSDTLMLSSISDKSVGAVGTANTYIGMFFILFNVISAGLVSVMSQYIGANRKGVAFQARQLAIVINGITGISLSLVLGIFAPYMLDGLGVASSLRDEAAIYLRIVGAGCLLDALIPVFSSYLMAFDKTKYSLFAAFSGNLVNIGCNALFLYGLKMGVMGVAIGTLIGKAVNLGLALLFGHILIHGLNYKERVARKDLISSILRVGFPSALETAIYSVAMAIVTIFLNKMDPHGLQSTIKAYATQICNFSYCCAFAFSAANIIIVGWAIGEGNKKECYHSTHKAALIAIGAGVLIETLLALISPYLLRIFTNDEAIIKAVGLCLYIDIGLEVGRAANFVYGQTLKSTGDSFFPAIMGIIFNSLAAVGGSYLFGVVLGWNALGVFFSMALDECFRGLCVYLRFRSGKWEKYTLMKEDSSQEAIKAKE